MHVLGSGERQCKPRHLLLNWYVWHWTALPSGAWGDLNCWPGEAVLARIVGLLDPSSMLTLVRTWRLPVVPGFETLLTNGYVKLRAEDGNRFFPNGGARASHGEHTI